MCAWCVIDFICEKKKVKSIAIAVPEGTYCKIIRRTVRQAEEESDPRSDPTMGGFVKKVACRGKNSDFANDLSSQSNTRE